MALSSYHFNRNLLAGIMLFADLTTRFDIIADLPSAKKLTESACFCDSSSWIAISQIIASLIFNVSFICECIYTNSYSLVDFKRKLWIICYVVRTVLTVVIQIWAKHGVFVALECAILAADSSSLWETTENVCKPVICDFLGCDFGKCSRTGCFSVDVTFSNHCIKKLQGLFECKVAAFYIKAGVWHY